MEVKNVDRTVKCRLRSVVNGPARLIHMQSSPPSVIRIHDDEIGLAEVYHLSIEHGDVAEYLFFRVE